MRLLRIALSLALFAAPSAAQSSIFAPLDHLLARPVAADWSHAQLCVLSQPALDALGEPPTWSADAQLPREDEQRLPGGRQSRERGGNDECAGAQAIFDGENGLFLNVEATDSQPPWPCGGTLSKDLWFVYTATCTGVLTIETCNPIIDMDTKIEVFAGGCGSLVSLGCNDDACATKSRVQIQATQGTSYWVRVGGFNGASGNFFLYVSCGGGGQGGPYQVDWKLSVKPDRASGLASSTTTLQSSCSVENNGTFTAGPIQEGTWTRDARGKLQGTISTADLQRIVNSIYGPGAATLESVLLAKTKLKITPGRTPQPGKIQFSMSASATFNGGQILKLKISFRGVEG